MAELNPQWNDDRLFFEARKIVGAAMQKITYGEWLPTVLGDQQLKRDKYFIDLPTSPTSSFILMKLFDVELIF